MVRRVGEVIRSLEFRSAGETVGGAVSCLGKIFELRGTSVYRSLLYNGLERPSRHGNPHLIVMPFGPWGRGRSRPQF